MQRLPPLKTINDLMDLWPSYSELSRDTGLTRAHLWAMKTRQAIPVKHWPVIIDAAKNRHKLDRSRGYARIDADLLLAIHTVTAKPVLQAS